MHFTTIIATAILGFPVLSNGHPGEHEEHNAALEFKKRELVQDTRRSLSACADKMERRGINARAQARRQAIVNMHRKKKMVRDTDAVLNTTHLSSEDYTLNTPETTLFSSNSTCVLTPSGEVGPYWVKGEHIRNDLADGQPGVPIVLDGQFIDVETCEPIEGLYWDLWNCNSTGVYSGLVATGNGNIDDTSNLNTTYLRGVAKTDADGVVQFTSVFPGHYSGRTTHHHMIAHLNATVLPNNTLTGGTVSHIGQLFWDQDIINQVEATYPYNTNNITITPNADDRVFATETADTTVISTDPVLEYVMLGDSLSDGLFGWVTIAVNVSASYDAAYSFVYTAAGGVAESGGEDSVDGGSGTGNGTMGGNGTMPTGSAPSGNGTGPIGNATLTVQSSGAGAMGLAYSMYGSFLMYILTLA